VGTDSPFANSNRERFDSRSVSRSCQVLLSGGFKIIKPGSHANDIFMETENINNAKLVSQTVRALYKTEVL
jgi:hypothetical protein